MIFVGTIEGVMLVVGGDVVVVVGGALCIQEGRDGGSLCVESLIKLSSSYSISPVV